MAATSLLSAMVSSVPVADKTTGEADRLSQNALEMDGSTLLVEKLKDVLRNMDYDQEAVEKVSTRAQANIVQAVNSPAESSMMTGDLLSEFVGDQLLNEAKLRQRNLRLNSNEPILLLEASKELQLSPERSQNLKDNVLTILRSRGIKPVRVYMRQLMNSEQPEFRMVMLNVVNTDIGGPSMVQLLDAAFHGEGWRKDLVLKEAWNGYDLLWRDAAFTLESAQDVSVPAGQGQQEIVDTATDQTPEVAEPEPRSTQPRAVKPTPSHYKDVNDLPNDEAEEEESEKVEHPAFKELREREMGRSPIQHPSWSTKEDNSATLDVIETQPADTKETEPMSIISGSSKESDDGFEVVDKA